MDVQQFIRRARGRWDSTHIHGDKDTVTVTAIMPIVTTVPLETVRKIDWDELAHLIDERVWTSFLRMKPEEKE